jgi:hypothetical protein
MTVTATRKQLSPAWILFILTGFNLFNYLDRFVLSAVLTPLQKDLGINDCQAGRLMTAFTTMHLKPSESPRRPPVTLPASFGHKNPVVPNVEMKFRWPLNRIDTNAAYQLATQWLSAVSMDVAGLNQDCHRSIRPWIPEGATNYFVPVYRVSWGKDGEPVALVELFLPTKTLRDLRVEKSKYILRKPIVITNLDFLLSQTNAPAQTNAPPVKQ